MLEIDEIRIENLAQGCVTDNTCPVISFSLAGNRQNTVLSEAVIKVGEWEKTVQSQVDILYGGELEPFTTYVVEVMATDNYDQQASATASFQTGRLGLPWQAKWITDMTYTPEKKSSPVPMTFQKTFRIQKPIAKAYISATAIGIFDLSINGKTVTDEYFAPGFTSYKNNLQYVYYDVSSFLEENNRILAVVGGGWAVGRFTYGSKSQITAKRQALLMELFLQYADGSAERIVTDGTWQVSLEGNYRFGDFYDGETFDATIDLGKVKWKRASTTKPGFDTRITARYGCPIKSHESFKPVKIMDAPNGETVYDFGQNFAGVVCLEIDGKRNQRIVVRHAEILCKGNLSVKSLRSAKATATYICMEGKQTYSPKLSYMGFRYVGITGIEKEKIQVYALAIYSDIQTVGSFTCSDPLVNQLQSNILWGAKSNFVDIPTDCPQRDERQGWTGDISVFSGTACFNFDLSRFFDKWLLDVRSEQGKLGGIPFVVPRHGDSWPVVPTACWGDACIIVPWAQYLARGSKSLLQRQYPTMRKYLKSVQRWARLFSFGDRRYIWKLLFQFGDWCAPEGYIRDWMRKGKWIATAYFASSCNTMMQIAEILGNEKDRLYFGKLHRKICRAYVNVFTDKHGTLKQEFQTAYVLPIYFNIIDDRAKQKMADNLARLVKDREYHLSTGFTGTPYLLFALSDCGKADVAYRLLLQDTYPSWLYKIKHGATTFWEQWGAVSPNNEKNGLGFDESDSEASFNHYAYGAVGDFLYRRVAGIEAISGGYKTFRIQPVIGGGLTCAAAQHKTPYGPITSKWKIENDVFHLTIEVPVSTECTVVLPSGEMRICGSGRYELSEKMLNEKERSYEHTD